MENYNGSKYISQPQSSKIVLVGQTWEKDAKKRKYEKKLIHSEVH